MTTKETAIRYAQKSYPEIAKEPDLAGYGYTASPEVTHWRPVELK